MYRPTTQSKSQYKDTTTIIVSSLCRSFLDCFNNNSIDDLISDPQRTVTDLEKRPRPWVRLFGVRLNGDVAERLCDWGIAPPLGGRRRRRLARIEAAGALFIHVPKNAGMSVSHALYGEQVKHATIRYYRRAAPGLVAAVPSFAIVRDPLARFVSAFRYARAGGTGDNQVSAPFRAAYRSLRTVDEALDLLERAPWPYGVDHIFRPQSWYVTDGAGRLAVDRLVPLERLGAAFADLAPRPHAPLARINAAAGPSPELSAGQEARLRRLYAADFGLFARAG